MTSSQSVRARLSVILKADDVVVAEIESPQLWQQVLTAINTGEPVLKEREHHVAQFDPVHQSNSAAPPSGTANLAQRLAEKLHIRKDELQGACSPNTTEPYLVLDVHCWEQMKRQLGRGKTIGPIAVSATLLALWCREAGLENPTQAQAQAVLNNLGVPDKNASRSIRNANWLQSRSGGQILINAAQNSRAITLAKCFCTGDWTSWKGPSN